jgi:hypothetical protein
VATPPAPQQTPPVPHAESGASSFETCGNCGAALSGPFCSKCGEKKVSAKDYTIGHVVEEVFGEFTHLDSRFLRTLKLLFTKPGQLSNAFFHGGRSRYTKPLTVFIIINVIFFFVQPGVFSFKYAQYMKNPAHAAAVHTQLSQSGESQQSYRARFDANLQNQKKSLLIVSVPLLALFMAILFVGSGRTYAEHLVLSVQVYAFLLAYLAAVAFLMRLFVVMVVRAFGTAAVPIARALESQFAIDAIILIGVATYMYLGFRRAYQASRTRGAAAAVALGFVVGGLFMAFQIALFYVTFWTT